MRSQYKPGLDSCQCICTLYAHSGQFSDEKREISTWVVADWLLFGKGHLSDRSVCKQLLSVAPHEFCPRLRRKIVKLLEVL